MNISEYRSHPALSYSTLKAYLRSPLHGLTQEPPTETAAMRFGTAVDLGMKGQLDQIIVNPFEDGRSKGAKEFKLEHAGKLILTQSEMDRALNCIAALKVHPVVQQLSLSMLEADKPLFGSIDGVNIKGLPDWAFGPMLIDLKTTSSPIDEFHRTVDAFHYDLQAAIYAKLTEQAGHGKPTFYWIVAESEKPFDICVYQASERIFEVGEAKLMRALRNVKACNESRHLGISDVITTLTMPAYYGRKFDDALLETP